MVNWACKACNSENKPLRSHFIEEKAKDVKCVLSVYNDFVVLAFRYTNTAYNVWQDILYPLQIVDEHTCSNCKVQKAYHTMWESIKEDVMADLVDIRKETNLIKLYITGISMGGGLTVISYIDIRHYEIFPTIAMTTFGAPRVGNKHWAAHFDLLTLGLTRRYIIKGDPVVVLPRCLTLLCTYRHSGRQIVCNTRTQQCVEEEYIPDDDDELYVPRIFRPLRKAIRDTREIMEMHLEEEDQDLGNGLMSHLNDYPKAYNYTLVLK